MASLSSLCLINTYGEALDPQYVKTQDGVHVAETPLPIPAPTVTQLRLFSFLLFPDTASEHPPQISRAALNHGLVSLHPLFTGHPCPGALPTW